MVFEHFWVSCHRYFSQTYDCSQPADHRHVRPGAFKPGAVGARSLIILQQKKELEAGRKELSDFRDFVMDEMVPSEERDRSFKISAGSIPWWEGCCTMCGLFLEKSDNLALSPVNNCEVV